jgi:DNA-binding CsgD family transcriptional regulator
MDSDVTDVLGALYDALLEPARWTDALLGYSGLFQATHAILAVDDCSSNRPEISWAGVAPAFQDLYGQSFVKDNSLVQLDSRGEFREQPYTDRMVLPAGDFQRTDFYQAWCRPQRIESLLGAEIIHNQRGIALLGLGRSKPFGDAELSLYRRLMHDLRRVMGLRLRLLDLDLQRARLRALLDEVNAPILLTNGSCRLQHANRTAVSLLQVGDLLRLQHGRLAAATDHETNALRDLIRKACCGEGGGSIRCLASDGKRAGVLVVPVRADHGWAEGAEQCTAVFVTRADDDTGPHPTLLRALYGLTPTEAALAAIVGRGEGLPAAASALGMRISTARTHLHRVFDKTATQRQSQLAWLLKSLS